MLGDSSTVVGSSSGDAAPAVPATETPTASTIAAAAASNTLEGGGSDVGGGGGDGARSNSADEDRINNRGEEGDRNFGGNRWPRQETLALLKIRSDMDVAFRDASVKGPLWDEVSRKLAELGYHRSAKKCKEKFENVYKYHKRTKEGRTGKSDGRTYRFFDQLQALENQPSSSSFPISPTSQQQHQKSTHHQHQPTSMAVVSASSTLATMSAVGGGGGGIVTANVVVPSHQNTVPSATHPLMSISSQPSSTTTKTTTTTTTPTINLTFSSLPPTNPTIVPPPHQPVLIQPSSATITTTTATTNPTNIPSPFHSISADLYSTSSSTSSDEEVLEGRRKRKRKWKDFFERLMKEVIQKQEELQKKFLEAIEKREQERAIREEAWRMQEMARINREREILAQERSIAAAKDTAVMAFLQKMSEQQQNPNPNPGQQPPQNIVLQPPPPLAVQPISVPPVQSAPPAPSAAAAAAAVTVQASAAPSAPAPAPASAPVPRPQPAAAAENNGENLMGTSSSRWPKMEVQALIKLRTDLDAKYQESGPKGPLWEEISAAMRKIGYNRSAKRCKEKWENINKYFKKVKESNKKRPEDSKTCPYFHQLDALYREKNKFENSPNQIKPENTIPLMVRPEQQWPPQQQDQNHPDSGMDDMESDPMDQNQDEDDKDEDEEEDEGDGNYELVANRPPPASVSAAE